MHLHFFLFSVFHFTVIKSREILEKNCKYYTTSRVPVQPSFTKLTNYCKFFSILLDSNKQRVKLWRSNTTQTQLWILKIYSTVLNNIKRIKIWHTANERKNKIVLLVWCTCVFSLYANYVQNFDPYVMTMKYQSCEFKATCTYDYKWRKSPASATQDS